LGLGLDSNVGSTEAAPFQFSVSARSRCSPSLASSSAALGWGQDRGWHWG
jgi:hypothetical protein